MLELVGKYNKCKVFTDNIESSAMGHIIALLNQESVKGSQIRIMPDVHDGKGSVIGTTMTLKDKVIPNLVGVDIGCGMLCIELKEKRIELPKLDSVINKEVPSGFSVREKEHTMCNEIDLDKLRCSKMINMTRAYKSIGTLGGGNHFIEVNEDTDGTKYIVIHTGSRNLGKQVAEYYQDMAWRVISKDSRDEIIKQKISELTSLGKQSKISEAIANIKKETCLVPQELAYCEGELFDDYIHDMKIVQLYAHLNRSAIAHTILKGMKWGVQSQFQTIHNYIDTDSMILRKGSISANKGETVIIPINMRDGSLICVGKGNADWNYSAPHGAGRLFSRSKAKELLTVAEFKKIMSEAGIYSTSVCQGTLSESPLAYKPLEDIVNNIGDTVDIIKQIKPIYNFKGSED